MKKLVTTNEQSSSCPKSALSAALPNANSNTDDHDVRTVGDFRRIMEDFTANFTLFGDTTT